MGGLGGVKKEEVEKMKRKTFLAEPYKYSVSIYPNGIIIAEENEVLEKFKEMLVPKDVFRSIVEFVNEHDELAEQHAEWFASTVYEIVKVVYREAFKHGWKHAEEELRK